ncbi:MAG: hypothetical protein ACHQF0_08800 [Chitinophagales bacterium]
MRNLIKIAAITSLLSCNPKNDLKTNPVAHKTDNDFSYPYKATYSFNVIVPSHPE